jgi:plastocyanin
MLRQLLQRLSRAGVSLLLVAPLSSSQPIMPPPAVPTVEVWLRGATFDPGVVVVDPGTRVVWLNRSVFPHTVDSDDGVFEALLSNSGDTFEWIAQKPGRYQYYCRFHGSAALQGMAGTIVITGTPEVEPPVEQAPVPEEPVPEEAETSAHSQRSA